MLSCLGVLAFAFVSSAIAQSNYNYTYGDLQAEAATAHFTQARIIPPLLGPDTTFMPQAYLNVSFPGIGQISFGQTLSPDQVQQPPNITVTFRSPYPLNANVSTMQTTVVLEDVGPAGHNFTLHQTRTWLVYNATLKGADGCTDCTSKDDFTLDTSAGTTVTNFEPLVGYGDGPHRYAMLLFLQDQSFTPPDSPISNPVDFILTSWMSQHNLKPSQIYAGFYFDIQNGTATTSALPTSPVISSTLPAHAASTLYPTFPTYAGSPSGSGSDTTNDTSGAGRVGLGWGLLGAVFGGLAFCGLI